MNVKASFISDLAWLKANYGFLLPLGRTSSSNFAMRIAECYDITDLRNGAAYDFAISLPGSFIKNDKGILYAEAVEARAKQ